MAVFSYNGGITSISAGGYGSISVLKSNLTSFGVTPATSARSFTEGTPAAGLFDPVDRVLNTSRVTHSNGYAAHKISLNTNKPNNTTAYYTPYNAVFEDIQNYNTDTATGDYWANAYGFVNSETGTDIAVDKEGNAWVTGSTDYCNATVSTITAALTPVASFTNSTTTMSSGTNDSGYWFLASPPFNHNIFNLNNAYMVVHTNSWLSFQPYVNPNTTAFSATTPNWANIQIGAGEASCQRIYWGTFGTAPNRTYRIRFEGTNATTGTLGSPNMVWEFIVYESNPNIFDIQIGAWTPPTTNFSGLSTGSNYVGGTYTPAANTARRFSTSNVTSGQSGNNITLVKYDRKGEGHRNKNFFPNGTEEQVVTSIGRDGYDVGESIKIGSDGKIYILYTSGSGGFVQGVTNNDLGIIKINPDHLYFTQYNTSNAIEWAKTYGTTSIDTGQSFDIDSNDNLYVTGFTAGSGQGSNDVIVIKVNKYGEVVWRKTYGGTGNDVCSAITVDSYGFVYVWGNSASTPVTSGNTSDYFVLKINSTTGSLVAQKHFNNGLTSSPSTFEHSIDSDEFGNVYVAGLASNPNAYFVSKLDSSLNFVWSRTIGAPSSGGADAPTGVRYKNGILYVTGQDSTYFSSGQSYGTGIAAINPRTGYVTSAYTLGGVGTEYGLAVDVDDYDNVYVTGATASTFTNLGSATNLNAFTSKLILDQPDDTQFKLSGSASTHQCLNVRYNGSGAIYSAQDIVFQDDYIGEGNQFISITSTVKEKYSKKLSGSGLLPPLVTTPRQIQSQTIQYLHRTNNLASASYSRSNLTSITAVSGVSTPVDNATVYNFITANDGGAPSFAAGYITPTSSTGTFAAGSVSVLSIFAKTNTWNKFSLLAYSSVFGSSGTLPNQEVRFDLNAGTSTNLNATNPPLDYGIIKYPNGWYRCWIKVQSRVSSNQSTGAGWFQIRFSSDSLAGSEIYFSSPQLQRNTFTSYVENTGTTALSSSAFIEDNITPTELSYNTPENTQLFPISGAATIKYVNPFNKPLQTYVGSSELAYLSAYEIAFDVEYYDYGTQFQFSSPPTSATKFEKEFRFTASGTFTTSGAATAIKKVLNPPENTQLFAISGAYTNLKARKSWNATGGTSVSGSARTKAPNRHIGSSPTEYITASAIVFGDEENIRTVTDGDAKYQFIRSGFTGSGTIIENPNSTKRTAKVAFVQINTIILYNTNVITKLAMLYAGKSPSTPFGGLDIVFEELEPNAPPQQFKYSGAASEPLRGFRWVGVGNVQSSGAYSNLKSTKDWVGSGSLLTNLSASSKVTFNPVEDTTLFVVTGGYNNLQSTKDWVGSGLTIFKTLPPPQLKKSFSFVGSSPIEYYNPYEIVFGEGEIFSVNSFEIDTNTLYEYVEAPYFGQGTLLTGLGGTAKVRFNPPEGTFLYQITGAYSNLKATKDWVGSGSLVSNVNGSATVSFNGGAQTQLFSVSGTVTEKYGKGLYTGDGYLFTASGSAEATGSNPPEDTFLFSVTNGYSNLRATKDWVGSGSTSFKPNGFVLTDQDIQGFIGASVPSGLGLQITLTSVSSSGSVSPRAVVSYLSQNNQIVFIEIVSGGDGYNQGDVLRLPVGSNPTITLGDLVNASAYGASSSVSSSWIGSSPIEYYNPYEIVFGEGEIYDVNSFEIDTNTLYEFTKAPYAGSGSLFTGSTATAKVRFNPPEDTQLFQIGSGYSSVKAVSREIFSGSLFTNGFYSDLKVTFNPPEDTYLFSVSGAAVEKNTEAWVGTGTLFNASGAAEATGVNPPEDTFLFSITGAYSDLRATKDWVGSGSTSITGGYSSGKASSSWVGSSPVTYYDPYQIVFGEGEIYDVNSFEIDTDTLYEFTKAPYAGSGSLFAIGGASKSTGSNPPEDTFLYSITGAYSNLKATKDWVGTGSTSITGSGVPSKVFGNFEGSSPLTYYDPYEIIFENEENFYSTELQVSNYATFRFIPTTEIGSGSLFTNGFASGTKVRFNPPEGTYLFSLSGQHGTRVFVPNWNASGSILTDINGSAKVTFNPPENTYLFSVTGAAIEKNTEAWVGSGNLFTASGASQSVGANPPEGTYLFSVSGTAGIKLRDYEWISPIVEFDPYQLVINDDFVVNDYIDIRNNIWDETNNITRSAATETFTFRTVSSGSLFTSGFFSDLKITWNPSEDTYLFSVSGNAVQKQTEVAIGSGSLFSASGAAEATGVNPPENTFLFAISGAATEKHVDITSGSGSTSLSGSLVEDVTFAEVGSGTATFGDGSILALKWSYNVTGGITISEGATASVTFNPVEDTTLFVVSGAATQSKSYGNYTGSGSLFTDGFYSNLKVTFNPPEDTYLYTFSGSLAERTTGVEVGSGNLFNTSGAAEAFGANPPENTFLFTTTGTLVERTTEAYVGVTTDIFLSGDVVESFETSGYQGSGSLFTASGAAEAFGSNPPENTFLYEITGAYSDLKATSVEIGSGSSTISGDYSDLKATSSWVGSGTFTVSGTALESYAKSNYDGSGSLFTASGSAEAFGANPPENTFLYEITGAYSDLKATSVEIGSGNLFTASGAAEATTFNPPEDTFLYEITGAYSDLKVVYTEIGSGNLFTASGAAEATGVNPPEDTFLYEITGAYSDLKATSVEIGSGSSTISGAYSDLKATSSWVGSGSINLSGYAIEKQGSTEIGSGNLFTADGAAEAFGANPPEDTFLYEITGAYSDLKATSSWVGSGSIFTDVNGTASVTFNPPEDTFLYGITGAYSDLKATFVEIGTGSIASLSGAAERVTWNPVEDTQLFVVYGSAVASQLVRVIGSGSIFTDINGTASVTFNLPENTFLYEITGAYSDLKASYVEVGSGSIASLSGAAERVTWNPVEETQLYTITGEVVKSTTNVTAGSGSLFTDINGTASVTFNPPENTFLYEISGAYSDLKATSVEIGSGNLFTASGAAEAFGINPPEDTFLFVASGAAVPSQTSVEIGSGSLFTDIAGVAAVTFNPPEDTFLFTITEGYSDLKATYVEIGSGSLYGFDGAVVVSAITEIGTGLFEISDTAIESTTYKTIDGSGSLFEFGGAVEAFGANPTENTVLFIVDGAYSDLKATYVEIGTGSLFGFNSATEAFAVTAEGTGLFEISDTAFESRTYANYDGSGSLFSIGSGVESVTFNPVEDTTLFEVSGNSYVTASFGYGGGTLELSGSGEAIFARALVPQVGEGSFFSSGESTSAKVFAPYIGSGSLFSVGGSSSTTTNVPVVGVFVWAAEPRNILYVFGGSAKVNTQIDSESIVLLNISGSGIVRTILPEKVFVTII